jgi:hypothetical protein
LNFDHALALRKVPMKITTQEAAARYVHRVDCGDVPDAVVRYLMKCATDETGSDGLGGVDVARVDLVDAKLGLAIRKFRSLTKGDRSSFGTDGGPADVPTTLSDTDIRVLWEDTKPESVDIAIAQLVQSLVDQGRSQTDAMALASRVVEEMPPPIEKARLDLYRGPALKRALALDAKASLPTGMWGRF